MTGGHCSCEDISHQNCCRKVSFNFVAMQTRRRVTVDTLSKHGETTTSYSPKPVGWDCPNCMHNVHINI